ncbi:MAG: thioredoxin family protein [Clostridia bacterium]|nr:thioredoxin family protein [Clostridia bacterium]
MALFNFGKKKEEEKKALTCCCGSTDTQAVETAGGCCCSAPKENEAASCCCGAPVDGICRIKVLGAGCKSCHEQYENAKAAARAMNLNLEVEYITDMEKVMDYGVMSMPAIVVNDKVVSMGKVLKAADVEKLLHKLGY